ncbi:MAG TPA: hypothetical protein PLP29_09875 [Candidatus Ozemobacteraceae bacterium]|nr:hypothetical protein [Candidatus Ozemobacteraceae bacterium]
MGKRMFFLSLLILSIAMGAQFYKNRPKTAPKKPKRPAAAVNLDDLELRQPGDEGGDGDETATDSLEIAGSPRDGVASGTATDTAGLASATETPDEVAAATDSSAIGDPVLLAFANLKRSPFEPSPFAKLVEQAQASAAAALAADPVKASKTKPTEVLNAPFGGTIETHNTLVAVIDKRLYRVGDQFQGKTIRKIEKTHVTLDDPAKIYLLPKLGVNITISSDTVSVTDDFMKKSAP